MVETNGMNLPAASLGLPEGTLRQAQIETANETPKATPPADSFSLASGQEIGGYRILRRLGAGGMGTVYEAEQLETGRRLALKVLSRCIISPELRSRFLREGQIAARVSHPNLVYVFGTEEVGHTPVITMELMAGGTLD